MSTSVAGATCRKSYGPESYFAVRTYLRDLLHGNEMTGDKADPCNVARTYLPMVKNPEIMLEVVVAKSDPGPVETRRVSIGADGLFRSDRSELTNLLPEGRAQLERLAQDIRSGSARIVCIMVTGHADRWALLSTTSNCLKSGPTRYALCWLATGWMALSYGQRAGEKTRRWWPVRALGKRQSCAAQPQGDVWHHGCTGSISQSSVQTQ